MSYFRGLFEYTIDPKGRVNVPAPFRDLVQKAGHESLMITRWQRCLYVFSLPEWDSIEAKLADISSVDPQLNSFKRFFVGSAVEVSFDKQGRILVPQSLREYAGLEKDIAITGMGRRFEIWSLERWNEEVGGFEKALPADAELAKRISDLGI
jgi:MraZ protein